MLKQKNYDTPYVVNNQSTIFFGKYRNQKHEVLKDDLPYCQWILSTEEGFADSTKKYIRDNILK